MIHIQSSHFAAMNDTVAGLKKALQTAIELEHSTIPPYLYALYSIKQGQNGEIAGLIRSVVREEMLHMSLDCNILNAIGGSPKIDHPKFIPTYPGPLPGCVEAGLIVPLAPFSKQLIHDVFMVIEEPEDVQHYPVKATAKAKPPETIGEFYAKIKQQINKLSAGKKNIFTGDPAKQLRTGFKELQHLSITDADSACHAIDLIVEQGEGSRQSPLDPEHELSHYYKYAEIYYGKKLISNPDPRKGELEYAYAGHLIPFDPCGVWPVINNPKYSSYKPATKLWSLNDTFNNTYSTLLRSLHLVFNGQPDRLGPALGMMESLREQAMLLMSSEVVPGQTAGPSFEYHP